MKFGKIGIVLVVVIALVGVYFFAPDLLSGVGSDEVRITPKYTNIPGYTPDDLTILTFLDGVSVDGSFIVKVGSTHSFTLRVLLPSGAIYGEVTRIITAPLEAGNYNMVIDGTTRTMELVKA